MAVLNRTRTGAISALAAIAAAVTLSASAPAAAQTKAPAAGKGEQFFPVLVYRTGAYAPNGTPWANGYVDYLKLVNAQGGINGITITFEECETGYATDRGVECYERLKGKGPTGATLFHPLSTGITFAVTDKTFARQDSDHHSRLWPCGFSRRRGLPVQLSSAGDVLERGRHPGSARRQNQRWVR